MTHTDVGVVPQGLRISLLQRSPHARVSNWEDRLSSDMEVSSVTADFCCCRCLVADYYISKTRRAGDHPASRVSIIVHVKDPFPEFEPSVAKVRGKISADPTISGVMRILAYNTWSDLIQDLA